jgi:4-amino-4-deoxy-L-arabinose transferase-like glycosyltransferase
MKRWWPEALLVVLALVAFVGCLGSVELWGKREQRAAAEAIDTIDHNHWLVAEIQGRPRLEKPPLPRWSIAALMKISGRRHEWIVRLPGSVSGILTVALIYSLGRRIAGRDLALASSFILCSSAFFVGEMRQAGNDGPLALFTTLALYAAWRRLEGASDALPPGNQVAGPQRYRTPSGAARWGVVFHCALGLGFLTKGPVILLLVGLTLIPYLAFGRSLSSGLRKLSSGPGVLIFLCLAASWPVAVLLEDPGAARVWALEMSEKTGLTQILEHRRHPLLLGQWPGMLLPWTLIAPLAVILPFLLSMRGKPSGDAGCSNSAPPRLASLWFPWWWSVGNLGLFSVWSVAKPSYYLPCLPGMALLIGAAWVELAQVGRGGENRRAAVAARGLLQAQWVLFFVAAAVAPLAVRNWLEPQVWPWSLVVALSIAVAVGLSSNAWRKGATATALSPLATACVIGFLVAYGCIGPQENVLRGHRSLAEWVGKIISNRSPSVMFFNEIDEGLWFYARGFALAPVPESQPRYNTAYDLAHSYLSERRHSETLGELEAKRVARDRQALVAWLDRRDPPARYLLIRARHFDLCAGVLAGRATPVLRETGLKRNELVLLEVTPAEPSKTTLSTRDASTRR